MASIPARSGSPPAIQRSKSCMPPRVVPSAMPTRRASSVRVSSAASARASLAAASAKAPARSGSVRATWRTSAAERGTRSSAGKPVIGAMAVRPASRPSQSARTPTPSGETAPQPVITAARLNTDRADYFTPAAPGSTRQDRWPQPERYSDGLLASAERMLLDRARVRRGAAPRRRAGEGDRLLALEHGRCDDVGAAHAGHPHRLRRLQVAARQREREAAGQATERRVAELRRHVDDVAEHGERAPPRVLEIAGPDRPCDGERRDQRQRSDRDSPPLHDPSSSGPRGSGGAFTPSRDAMLLRGEEIDCCHAVGALTPPVVTALRSPARGSRTRAAPPRRPAPPG